MLAETSPRSRKDSRPCTGAPDARARAAAVLAEVLSGGRSLSACAPEYLGALPDTRDRAFAQELAYGTLRWLPQLQALLAGLVERPLKPKDQDIAALILIGLYQLVHLGTPQHAAVSATVAASQALGKAWAGPLVNAVLRHYLRDSEGLLSTVGAQDTARYAHPSWLLEELRAAWPESWSRIADANNHRPPMTLRVNARQADRETYMAALAQAGLEARPAPYTSHGLILSQALEVRHLPGFRQGQVSVQDGSAQLAAPLLDLRPGQRILDACAAPGGKTAQILETCPGAVIAVERDPERITRLHRTLARLRLEAEVIHGDAARPELWWDGHPFERILLDAPCSGSGVIRRHPDIKVHRHRTDLTRLAADQAALLAALWPLLTGGGKLLYATCSVFPIENQDPIRSFLRDHSDACLLPLDMPWGRDTGYGRQILPGEADMDGFFYALLGGSG